MRLGALIRAFAWLAALGLVVLGARSLAYALSPSPLAATLEHRAGGPRLPVISAVSFVLALAISSAVVWLAWLAVRERRLLEPAPLLEEPRLRFARLAVRTLLLIVVANCACALLESYIHWRAGLGWHGLHCLIGPVHRDMIPFVVGLSLVASAAFAAAEHVVRWLRRTILRIRRAPRIGRDRRPSRAPLPVDRPVPAILRVALGARAPPF